MQRSHPSLLNQLVRIDPLSISMKLWIIALLVCGLFTNRIVLAQPSPGEAPAKLPVQVERLPAPGTTPGTWSTRSEVQPPPNKDVPITLDTIFRLAESQNAKLGSARARVAEAAAESDLASKKWLPDLYVGAGYHRHEGGIANEDGTLTRSSFGSLFGGVLVKSTLDLRDLTYQRLTAERSYWQQKAQLSQLTSEVLVEASTTYIDMLTARTSELIAMEIEKELQDLLSRSENFSQAEASGKFIVPRIRTFLAYLQQSQVQAREEFARAAAKLTYLLGLDPCITLVPLDERLLPLELVDASVSCCDLVAQVLANGPGIYEVEQILAIAHQAIEQANGPGRFLPVFETRMVEGGFGTGPGDQMTWDNRWDLGLAVRWNLTDLFTHCDRQRVLHAKAAQAHFADADLRGQLAASVQEARDSILFGREEIRVGDTYVEQARLAYTMARDRMIKVYSRPDVYDDTRQSLEALARARLKYLDAIRTYDKAQLRLLVVLGIPLAPHPAANANVPSPPAKQQ
jgi:outer membrane protein TolC